MSELKSIETLLTQLADTAPTNEAKERITLLGKSLLNHLYAARAERADLASHVTAMQQELGQMHTAITGNRVVMEAALADRLDVFSGRLHTFANFLMGVENKIHELVEMQQILLDAVQQTTNERSDTAATN